MKNALNWFEIPVRDMDRAVRCYETLLGSKFSRQVMEGMPYAVFPHDPSGVGGGLVQDASREPGGGTLVYLNADGTLDDILARAEAANVQIVLPKTNIGEAGFIALLVDSEGNRVGLNSSN